MATIELTGLSRSVLVPATATQPRNMGADLIALRDGRLLMGASRWLGGAHDNDGSMVFGLTSDDGKTWTAPFDIVLPDDGGEAVRMPNFLRLKDGRLACFCRHRTSMLDTWTGMTICLDEEGLGKPGAGPHQWSAPRRISPPAPGRHVLLNNRVVRLRTGPYAGRILLPLASPWPWEEEDWQGTDIRTWILLSDDDGATWRPSRSMLAGPERGLMEPYIVELDDGRLRMWMRTQVDTQYESVSADGGLTWSPAAPGALVSPESPVAVARHEKTGLLAVVWNHNRKGKHTTDRTPICIAFSADEGASWSHEQRLDPAADLDNLGCTFSYPGIDFLGEQGFVTYYENRDGKISLILRTFDLRLS
ncbi:MAG: hypothetical protein GKR89_35460 [Candidatus Latescibacteria bacterium]|nr:hypothetical protein [Candidatus Latescibacterota bacterium]